MSRKNQRKLLAAKRREENILEVHMEEEKTARLWPMYIRAKRMMHGDRIVNSERVAHIPAHYLLHERRPLGVFVKSDITCTIPGPLY